MNELDHKKLEDLKKQNEFYFNKLKEAQKKIIQANTLVDKAKKFNSCVDYVSEIINLLKPENEKQALAISKLKTFVEEYEKEKSKKK